LRRRFIVNKENEQAPVAVSKKQLLKQRIKELEEHVAKLTAEVKQEKDYKDMYSRNASEANRKLEAAHASLDVFPFVPRTVDKERSYGGVDKIEVSLEGRIMALIGRAGGLLAFSRGTTVHTEE